jgi:hypothetical protein
MTKTIKGILAATALAAIVSTPVLLTNMGTTTAAPLTGPISVAIDSTGNIVRAREQRFEIFREGNVEAEDRLELAIELPAQAFVIDDLNVIVQVYNEESIYAFLQITNADGKISRRFIPMQPQYDILSAHIHMASLPVQLYAAEGATAKLFVSRAKPDSTPSFGPTLYAQVNMGGHFLP